MICLKGEILITEIPEIPEMNTSRKALEWLICFYIVNLKFGCLLSKNFKKLMNLVHCQKQLECHQHILNEI